ncbi:hypothetical protein AB0C07_21310 [Actinoplanes missouriensis]|uniref:hypothetical protein n=1 Tax=Actinoplanes missouriensis TaxID=1866 RepID=UPI0033E98813
MTDVLVEIQRLQHTDKAAAEHLLRNFIGETFPLEVAAVELRPLAVSLNSFNGFVTLADGHRMFFKTHIEPNAVISEFYNSALLLKVGYSMLEPVFSSMEAGHQLLIYEVVDQPSVFDVAWRIETGAAGPETAEALTAAQRESDRHLTQIYAQTLQWQGPESAEAAPVHQLFHHRLTGARFASYYPDQATVSFPGARIGIPELLDKQWVINNSRYDKTLNELIAEAGRLLQPGRSGAAVVGHGDAHNGNLFFFEQERRLLYFDPAFGGLHDPFLDLAKPLFHNTFAMWMYYPRTKADELTIDVTVTGSTITVTHDYHLPEHRLMFLRSKMTETLAPLIRELDNRGWLPDDWRRRLKAALFCCPLLTKNLADGAAFPPEIALLGFSQAVEMGAESGDPRSLLDRCLDEVEAAL